METKKHHYRAVYKSDHLGIADLEDFIEAKRPLIFTISHVRQEMGVSVAGKKGDHNIAYFTDPGVKPWVLNAGNAKIIKGFAGGDPFVENWNNIPIELYIDETVKMKGEIVGGVRVRPVQPIIGKAKKPFTEAMFEKAQAGGYTIDKIRITYDVSKEIEDKYNQFVKEKQDAAA